MIFKKQNITRLFFATDIHGSERLFRKFINAAKVYGVRVLVLGGDITGKALVPCIPQAGANTPASSWAENTTPAPRQSWTSCSA